MLAVITILAFGAVAAFIMILAASMLSSRISSMEGEYLAEESVGMHNDPELPGGLA